MSDNGGGAPRFPEVRVKLLGEDGNAFHIVTTVRRAMRAAGLGEDVCREYLHQAMSGSYDELLRTTMRWVTVE